MANTWRHCVDLTGPGIEPQTSRTDSVRLATELAVEKKLTRLISIFIQRLFFCYDLINPTVFVLNNPTTNLFPQVARNCFICPFSYILRKFQLLYL